MILNFGEELAETVVDVKPLRTLLGAEEKDQLVLTGSSQEAINQLLFSLYLEEARESGKNQFILSRFDETAKTLQELGSVIKMMGPDLESLITPRTALISMPFADSLTGAINPVEEVAELCKEQEILFHLDVTTALGLMPLPQVADFITFQGLLPGTGGLLMRQTRVPFMALQPPSANLQVLLVKAAQEALEGLDYMALEVVRLRNHFERRLQEEIKGVEILMKDSFRLPSFSAVRFSGVHSDALLYRLANEGIYARGEGTTVSFSFPREVALEDLERTISVLKPSVAFLQKLSEGVFYEV